MPFRLLVASLLTLSLHTTALAKTDLSDILASPEFSNLPNQNEAEARQSAIWSEDGKLLSFCYYKSCYFVDLSKADYKIIDISRSASLGYFGTNSTYDQLEVRPIIISENEERIIAKWSDVSEIPEYENKDNVLAVLIRTRIWKDGQRYTRFEPVLIIDGVYHGR